MPGGVRQEPCPNLWQKRPQSSAGILAGWPEGVVALGAAGVTPAGQPPGRGRYNFLQHRLYRLYWFLFLSACRSRPSSISRSIKSEYSSPDAAHSLGYMLIAVNPGMVLISFR